MPGLGRILWTSTQQTTRQISCTERIPCRRGVHDFLDFLCRHCKRLTVTPNQARLSAALEHHFGRANLRVSLEHRIAVTKAKQRLLVIHGQQRQIDVR